ncbi:hypothetical protein [Burkholderia anthina]|uniref:hypothetical protein n=1 Tax=Burkholderia anthina TaxID=179879 RepID=UPI00158DA56A|nr:hypothetical protein [Burkholderia anthina]
MGPTIRLACRCFSRSCPPASHRAESRAGTGCGRFSRRQYVISKTEKTRDARLRIVWENAIRYLNEIKKFRFGGIAESRGSRPGFSR